MENQIGENENEFGQDGQEQNNNNAPGRDSEASDGRVSQSGVGGEQELSDQIEGSDADQDKMLSDDEDGESLDDELTGSDADLDVDGNASLDQDESGEDLTAGEDDESEQMEGNA